MEIYGFVPLGYDGELVRVEVDLRPGIPGIEIVGLPTMAIREARERIRIAWRNTGFPFPQQRILINLSPADLPKSGSGFDLPMALALIAACGHLKTPSEPLIAVGELALDGSLRRVPGILSALARARAVGVEKAALPLACREEAEAIPGFGFVTASRLQDLVATLNIGAWEKTKGIQSFFGLNRCPRGLDVDFQSHPETLSALVVAAAGGHSLLLYGPPGGGKTLAARGLQKLLPPLEPNEAWDVARLKSLRGELNRSYPDPPFREPHHSASLAGLVGGGREWEPGEAALAHRGVLFLDEAPQFVPSFLQTLREPLEDGLLRIARAGRQMSYPARFQLVMTANACPCGQTGKKSGVCLCGAQTVRRYWDRIGGALMDRVDIRFFMGPEVGFNSTTKTDWSKETRRLENALAHRRIRKDSEKNAWSDWREILKTTPLSRIQKQFWNETVRHEDWSWRGAISLIRLARTLADLEDRESIRDEDLERAVQFRKPGGEQYWQD